MSEILRRLPPASPAAVRRTRGMTLLEVLAAFVIFTLVVGATLHALAGSMRLTAASQWYSGAALVARSQLDAVGHETALEAGVQEGEEAGGYRWTLVIEPWLPEHHPPPDAHPGPPPLRLYRIELKVTGDGARMLEVATVRTVRAP